MKKSQKISIAISAAIIASVAMFNTAHGFNMIDVPLMVMAKVSLFINYWIGYIGGIFVWLASNLVNWSMDLNNGLMQSNVVQIGWVIIRDVANLGFVLAIILIALATILRMEKYAMKQVLWKLIVAALLVNFSMVIAGFFIDLGGMLTNFFLNKATGYNISSLGSSLANSFQVQKILIPKDLNSTNLDAWAGMANNFNGLIVMISSAFFVALLTIAVAMALFGIGCMFFLRYMHLTFLVIIMPLAWLAWIWPSSEGKFSEWWSNFFKWIWFGPIAAFSIYLALSIAEKGLSSSAVGGTQVFESGFAAIGLTINNLGGIIAQMVVIIGIITGGLMMANNMAGHGADLALKGFGGARNLLVGGAVRGTGKLAGRAAGGVMGWAKNAVRTGFAGSKAESTVQGVAKTLSGVPGLRWMGSGISKAVSNTKESTKQDIETYRKENLSHLTNDQLVARANAPIQSAFEKITVFKELTERKIFEGTKDNPITEERQLEFFKEANNFGETKEFLKTRPDLAINLPNKPGESAGPATNKAKIQSAVNKIKGKEADDISNKALENGEVMFNLNKYHLEKILKDGSNEQKEALVNGLMKLREQIDSSADETEKLIYRKSFDEKIDIVENNPCLFPFIQKLGLPKRNLLQRIEKVKSEPTRMPGTMSAGGESAETTSGEKPKK